MSIVDNISRRGVLGIARTGIIAYVGSSLLFKLAESDSSSPYNVETEQANFHIFNGFHGENHRPSSTIQAPKNDIKFDAFFLETGKFPYMNTKGEITMSGLKDTKFYTDIVPYLEQNNIPILFGDIPMGTARYTTEFIAQNAIDAAAVLGGAQMAFPKKVKDEPTRLTRRDILRVGGGASLFWGGTGFMKYLATPDIFRQPWAEDIRKTGSFSEFMHPEDLLIAFRNAMIAEKLLFYADRAKNESGDKPTIGIAVGGAHALLPEYLKEGRGYAQGFINRYPDAALKAGFGENYNVYLPLLIEVQEKNGSKVARKFLDPELIRGIGKIEGNRSSSESKA